MRGPVAMPFAEDLLGHDIIIHRIKDLISSGRIPHAQLYTGPEGIGKKLVAASLAKTLNCGKIHADYCNLCPSCVKINKGIHPDITLIRPEKTPSIKINQLREWQQRLNYKPYMGHWKVTIIDEAEKMTIEASNSILKVLEEPPANTLIILITTEASNLLPTIVSRCQLFKFHPLPQEKIIQFLIERKKYSKDQSQLIWYLSNGCLSVALTLNIDEIVELRKKWVLFFHQIEESQPPSLENMQAQDLGEALRIMLQWLRDVRLLQKGIDETMISNLDILDDLKKQAAQCPSILIENRINLILNALYALDKSTNVKVIIQTLSMQWNNQRGSMENDRYDYYSCSEIGSNW
ncbi:MAG: DNA polymerase III subunit delta' [bacterium]